MSPADHFLEIVKEIRKGDNITAIKYVKESFGLSLKEAKYLVEAIASVIDYKKE